jgi:hypothetical protein
MEQTVTRLRFRIAGRGVTMETEGRIVHSPDGTHVLQVGCSTAEQAHILLEAGPVTQETALWGLFHKLCDYKNFQVLEYRVQGPRGLSDWQPLPGPSKETAAPPPAKKKKA